MSDERRSGRDREVPVGLEKVLYLAATEPAFRDALLRDRAAAVRARGIRLRASELSMLELATPEQLASSIDALDTSEASLARRGFMRAVAGAVTLAAGSVLSGCGEDAIQPDAPHRFESGGMRPWDLGLDAPPAPTGIRPDDVGLEASKPDQLGVDAKRSEGGLDAMRTEGGLDAKQLDAKKPGE